MGRTRLIRGAALFLLMGAAFVGGNAVSGLRNSEPAARKSSAKDGVSKAPSFEHMLDAAANRSGASTVDDGPENASGEPDASDSLVAAANGMSVTVNRPSRSTVPAKLPPPVSTLTLAVASSNCPRRVKVVPATCALCSGQITVMVGALV